MKLSWTGAFSGYVLKFNDHLDHGHRHIPIPASRTGYHFFHRWEHHGVPLGRITIDQHPVLSKRLSDACAAYDNARWIAWVSAVDDDEGIWLSGRLRRWWWPPDRARFRRSNLSPDWRRPDLWQETGAGLEMIGVVAYPHRTKNTDRAQFGEHGNVERFITWN